MALQFIRTQFNLSEIGAVSGGSAADVVSGANRGTGEIGYNEFLAAVESETGVNFTLHDIEFARDLNTQIIVFDDTV